MRKGGTGGAIASKSGSDFELKTQDFLINSLLEMGYEVVDLEYLSQKKRTYRFLDLKYKRNNLSIYYQSSLYKYFFKPRGIDVKDIFSHELRPDTAIYSTRTNVLTIIEKKQQNVAGSVAEKLQTCDYKYMFYSKLCKPLNIKVELVWELGSYFEQNKETLRSVFEYMFKKNNKIFFHQIDVNQLNI